MGPILVTVGTAIGAVPALVRVSSPSAPAAAHTSPVIHVTRHTIAHASGPIWATDVPGWITGVGTAILAIFAIVAAYYARKAFRKQSQEVRAIEQQVTDQQEITRQQAALLEIQRHQLELQQKQFDQQADERRRAQASRVFIWIETGPDPRATNDQATTGEGARFGVIAHVRNPSEQPIYALNIDWGPEKPEWMEYEHFPVLMPGDQKDPFQPWPEIIDITRRPIPELAPFARFRDAAGLHWRLTADGQLDDDPGERRVKPLRIRPSVGQ